MTVHLHVNVDHIATLRQARGTKYPDPVHAAVLCELAGAHGITVHLREDRRHIQDRDVALLRQSVGTLLNLEMANTPEMVTIAGSLRPDVVTLVPESREERTTEGGLDVVTHSDAIAETVRRLGEARVPVSLFIDPEADQVDASAAVGAVAVELHTGDYCNAVEPEAQLERLVAAAKHAADSAPALRIAAGHGLTRTNVVALVARMPQLVELNIGHALIADAAFLGLEVAVRRFLSAIEAGERSR